VSKNKKREEERRGAFEGKKKEIDGQIIGRRSFVGGMRFLLLSC